MDTNNLKDTWITFNEKLDKQENFKEEIIREILNSKSSKSLSRLISYEVFNTIVIILLIPFLLYIFDRDKITPLHPGITYGLIVTIGISLISQIWKVYLLMKVDFSNAISSNVKSIERYKIHLNREKILIFIVILLTLIIIVQSISQATQIATWRWACAAAGILIGITASVWSYKRFYKNNIRNIIDSMKKLKDLDENSDSKIV